MKHLLDFDYHSPSPDQQTSLEFVREAAYYFLEVIEGQVPNNRNRSVGLTQLEIAVQSFNKAIILGEDVRTNARD